MLVNADLYCGAFTQRSRLAVSVSVQGTRKKIFLMVCKLSAALSGPAELLELEVFVESCLGGGASVISATRRDEIRLDYPFESRSGGTRFSP